MTCELIRVNFKEGIIKSRQVLDKEEVVEFKPYKDDFFKEFIGGMADMAIGVNLEGGNPKGLIAIATDEDVEIDWVIFDPETLSADKVICSLKRIILKLESNLEETPEAG
jgi:hypothetical protein